MANEGLSESLKVNLSKCCLASDYYATSIPALSRFYMKEVDNYKKELRIAQTPSNTYCKFCGSIFRPGYFKVKFLKRMRLTKKVKRLLQRKEEKGEKTLGKFQKKLVNMYNDSTVRVAMTCCACHKRTVISCPNKPDKVLELTATNVEEEVLNTKKLKSAKKRMKQKRKRKVEAEKMLNMPGMLSSKKQSRKITTNLKQETIRIPTTVVVQSNINEPTNIPTANKQVQVQSVIKPDGKKKGKNFNQTLQRMFNQEKKQKSNKASSSSSLQNFLSSL